MSTVVENINPISVENEPKHSVLSKSGATVEIQEPEYAVTVQRKEYKVVGDNIYIPKLYDDAPQWMKDLIGTVVDIKTAVAVGNLNDALEALRTLATELEVAKNIYTMSIVSSNDIDERITTAIETLNSSLTAADATILNIAQTAVTPEEASAIAINTLSASLSASGAIGSFISNMNAAFADLDSATTESINYMESAIEAEFSANATAVQTIRTYVGIDEAGASTGTGLSAYLEGSDGTIGGADSQLVNNIRVTAEGVESKWAYNSTVNIGGIYKKSGFGLTTNYTSGAGTEANPYVSEFWIDASRLKFTNSNMTGQVAPFTIDATGATPNITFNGKVSFTNVTNTIGTGSNLLYNSAPKIGSETKGWYVWTNSGMTVNLSAGFDVWKPTGGASVAANIVGNPKIGIVYDVGQSSRFPVIAGSRYEASAYISAHRSNSYVNLVFYDRSGTNIGEYQGNTINYAGNNALVNWGRSSVFTTAPGNAATALLIIRSIVTGNDPYCFVTNAFAGVAEANQTIPSNWSEGTSAGATYTSELSNDAGYVLPAGVANAINTNTTTINGSKITTGSITAAQINTVGLIAENISASEIVGITLNGARINGAVIKASYLDLDGELEVLTNYHISVATRNSNPSLYSDAIYISADNEYRIPSISSITESGPTVSMYSGSISNGTIHAYNIANIGNNRKAVKNRPFFQNYSSTLISASSNIGTPGEISVSSTIYLRLGSAVIATVTLSHYSAYNLGSGAISISSPYSAAKSVGNYFVWNNSLTETHTFVPTGITKVEDRNTTITGLPVFGDVTIRVLTTSTHIPSSGGGENSTMDYLYTTSQFFAYTNSGSNTLTFDWDNSGVINVYSASVPSGFSGTIKTNGMTINNMV